MMTWGMLWENYPKILRVKLTVSPSGLNGDHIVTQALIQNNKKITAERKC